MPRRLRSPEELREIFDNYPTIESLYEELRTIENLTVQPDGTGACIFKVYLDGRMAPYEAFLWVGTTLHRSYIQWAHQGDCEDKCRELWGPYVKNRSNPDGSQLQKSITADNIMRVAKQYADYAKKEAPLS